MRHRVLAMAAAAVKMTSDPGHAPAYPSYGVGVGPISGMSRQVHALGPQVAPQVPPHMSSYPFSSYHSMFPGSLGPSLGHPDPSSLFFSDIASASSSSYGYQHNMYGSYGMGSPFFRYKDMNR